MKNLSSGSFNKLIKQPLKIGLSDLMALVIFGYSAHVQLN